MADRRRTMQPPEANASSRLPMPASAMKPPAQGVRPSIAPGAGHFNPRMSTAGPLRMSMMGPPPVPSTVSRPSVAYRNNANPLLQSASKNHARTPMGSSMMRRDSMFPRGAPVQPQAPASMKDPRALREKAMQAAMWDDIVRWLQETSFEISADMRPNGITGQSFRLIFEHLVSIADPDYWFPPPEMTREKGKWEAEFTGAINHLRYPWPIDTKWLAAPVAMHSWPSLLGCLHWLADLGKARIYYIESQDPTLLDPACVPEDFDEEEEEYHAALALEYFADTYDNFLHNGLGTFPEQDRTLESRYKKKNETILKEIDEKQKLLDRLDAEREKLVATKPKVDQWKQRLEQVESDLARCKDMADKYSRRMKKEEELFAKETREVELRETERQTLRGKLEALERTVREQNLSAEEVSKMNSDHESLAQTIKDLDRKIADSRAQLMSLEVAVTNRATAAEEAVDAYNGLLLSLHLRPADTEFARSTASARDAADADLALELHPAADTPDGLLRGPDVRRTVRPALHRVAEQRRLERERIETARIACEHEVDGLVADCDVVQAEISAVARDVAKLTDEADAIREAAADEAAVNDQRAEDLERELVQAKQAAKAHGVGAKSRLQALQIAEQEQIEKLTRLREETGRGIMKNCEEMVKFREHMSTVFVNLNKLATGH